MRAHSTDKHNKNEEDSLIVLDTFYDYFVANIARHKLEAHDIECYLEENNQSDINSLGSIELKVLSGDLQSAFEILSE